MKPIRKSFMIEKHEDSGTIGVRPIDMPHADPLSGMAAAHDMLEHFPSDDGGIEDEFQALGAAVYVRGIPGYFAQRARGHDAAENIGSEFPELFRHWAHEGFCMRRPPRTLSLAPRDEHAETMIQSAVNAGIKLIRDEVDNDADVDPGFWLQPEGRRSIVGWMRRGYRRAARRYAHTRDWRVCETFRQIEAKVDKLLERGGEDWVGCRMEVYARVADESVTVVVVDGMDADE